MLPLLAWSSDRPVRRCHGLANSIGEYQMPTSTSEATPHSRTAIKLTCGILPLPVDWRSGAFPHLQCVEMGAELTDGAVERTDVAKRPRLHHPAFHHIERELGERAQVGALRETAGRRAQACLDLVYPAAEIGGHQLAHRLIRFV